MNFTLEQRQRIMEDERVQRVSKAYGNAFMNNLPDQEDLRCLFIREINRAAREMGIVQGDGTNL
jgi:ribosomal protein L20